VAVKLEEVRKVALALPHTTEEPHHNFGSFRVRGKIFVTVPPGGELLHIFLPVEQRELALVHQHWSTARSEFKRKLAEGAAGEAAGLFDPIVVLRSYESQVLAASTWPFNPKIVKELVASLVAPILIYGLKIALGLSRNA